MIGEEVLGLLCKEPVESGQFGDSDRRRVGCEMKEGSP